MGLPTRWALPIQERWVWGRITETVWPADWRVDTVVGVLGTWENGGWKRRRRGSVLYLGSERRGNFGRRADRHRW